MLKSKIFALVYRIFAFMFILAGIISGSGFNAWPRALLFYTTQSNLLVLLLFMYLAIRTAIDLKKNGKHGCICYAPAASMSCTVFILFTFIIFWGALAPFVAHTKLWTFGNITVHAISPILMMLEHFLFCVPGRLKKRNIFYSALLPIAYIIEIVILGQFKVVFYHTKNRAHYAPYVFMDFGTMGWIAVGCTAIIGILYVIAAWLLVSLDEKRTKKKVLYPEIYTQISTNTAFYK